jgi:D-methionine transport system substrate-binding protein
MMAIRSRSAGCWAVALITATLSLAGCKHTSQAVRIGVTPGPAEEILAAIKPELDKEGVQIEVVPFTDYIQPDLALSSHDLDANLYQNRPFLERFNQDHKTHFVALQNVYVPLMAVYSGKAKSLTDLSSGAKVSLPNDPVNEGRALILLESAGLLKLRSGAGAHPAIADVADNPKHLSFVELDASQLTRSRQDVDISVINANFALDAGLNPTKDALFHESPDSIYVNVLASNRGAETDDRLKKLGATLRSEQARSFIASHYRGAILPAS